jgi:N-formylglutamate deformylase
MTDLFKFKASERPLLVSIPHSGIEFPSGIESGLNSKAKLMADTDWYVDRLYQWVPELGAGMIVANYSRYLIDLNRPPNNEQLYETKTPGLVPTHSFSGESLYQRSTPDKAEIDRRVSKYWQPYHQAIRMELDRLLDKFGYVVLFDAHSIKSTVPGLFEGRLPDLNLGTNEGKTASASLMNIVQRAFQKQSQYSCVVDGRFKGGYITRNFGTPGTGVHALQLEMSQAIYMNEVTQEFNPDSGQQLMEFLKSLLTHILEWHPNRD